MLENIGAKQEILNCVEYVEHDHKEANVLRSICLYFFHHKDKVNILTAPFSSMEDPKSERTSLAYFWLSKVTQYISLNHRKEPQTDLYELLKRAYRISIEKELTVAKSGGYRNNCSFHCLAHIIFSQPEHKLRNAFRLNPHYNQFMHFFSEYYELGDSCHLDNFLRLINQFSHPTDREIVFGQALRCYFRLITENPSKDFEDGQYVSDYTFGYFANLLGVSLEIDPVEYDPKLIPQHPLDKDSELCKLHIIFAKWKNKYNHYNFRYENELLNEVHNHPSSVSTLVDVTRNNGILQQEEAVKEAVQLAFVQMVSRRRLRY